MGKNYLFAMFIAIFVSFSAIPTYAEEIDIPLTGTQGGVDGNNHGHHIPPLVPIVVSYDVDAACFYVSYRSEVGNVSFNVVNMNGDTIVSATLDSGTGTQLISSDLADGVYCIEFRLTDGRCYSGVLIL